MRTIGLFFVFSSYFFMTTFMNAHEEQTPDQGLQAIIDKSISSFLSLQDEHKDNNIVRKFIDEKLLDYFDSTRAINIVLKRYYQEFNEQEITLLERYLVNTLINDYIGFLTSYDKLDKVVIKALPNPKVKLNLAIVEVEIIIDNEKINTPIFMKIINKDNNWRIYDLVISNVSFLKNYQAIFNNKIRRQGKEEFLKSTKNRKIK